MDEKFLEQASDLAEARRERSQRMVAALLQGEGQADCEDCGETIPPARRQAMPNATRCVAHQTIFERKHK